MNAVHTHDIIAWQRCKRQFFLGNSRFGLGYKSNAFSPAKELGNLFHAAAYYHYGGHGFAWEEAINRAKGDAMVKHFPGTSGPMLYQPGYQEFQETTQLLRAMCAGYQMWQESEQDYYGDHNLAYAAEFEELSWTVSDSLFGDIGGRIDHLVYHKPTKEHWIIEHKTTGYPRDLIVGLTKAWQPRIYTWAMRKLYPDLNIVGVLYNVVTSTDPWNIKRLKTGYPSQAKAELDKTSYDIYLQELKECALAAGEDEDVILKHYAPQLDYLKGREYPLYFRHPLRIWRDDITERQVRDITWGIQCDYEKFVKDHGRDPAYVTPNLTGHVSSRYGGACLGCPFSAACQIMDQGQPWEHLLQHHFTQEQEEG